jgi:amino acid permease
MNTAGPGGLLLAWAFVAITSICVMEGLSEMIVMWPVANAMVTYVRVFVDEDLAIVIGLAYWFVNFSAPYMLLSTLRPALTLNAGTLGHQYSSPSLSLRLAFLNIG